MARVRIAALAAVAAITCALWTQRVHAAECESICSTSVVYGFLPGGTAGCTCSGSGSTASSSCQCGPCYDEQGDGTVLGYALTDGACVFGTNCADCDASTSASDSASGSETSASDSSTGSQSSSSSSSSSSGTARATPSPSPSPTPVLTARPSNVSTPPTTDAPTPTGSASNASSSQASASHSASRSGDGSAGSGDAGSTTSSGDSDTDAGSSSDSGGLETWQIALIIASAVLAFGVACVSILTCYCKARRRLMETEEDEEAAYYHPPRSGSGLTDGGLAVALMPSSQRPSSNHSQHGGFKASPPMDAEPTMAAYSSSLEAGDRIGLGMSARRSNGSNGDLAGSFSADRRPSQGSYSHGRRPSDDVYYSTRDRDAMAVEL